MHYSKFECNNIIVKLLAHKCISLQISIYTMARVHNLFLFFACSRAKTDIFYILNDVLGQRHYVQTLLQALRAIFKPFAGQISPAGRMLSVHLLKPPNLVNTDSTSDNFNCLLSILNFHYLTNFRAFKRLKKIKVVTYPTKQLSRYK